MILAYHAAEIMLYKVGFAKPPMIPESSLPGSQRIELLCACHASVVALFDAFIAIPASDYKCLTLTTYIHLVQGFTALSLLSTFEHDNWDIGYLPQPMGICEVLGKAADRFEAAGVALGFNQDNDSVQDHLYSVNAKKMRVLRDFYRTRILAKAAPDITQTPSDMDRSNGANTSAEEPLNFMDEAWLCELMGPWEYQGL
jgi:hypothetical protein